MARWLTSLAVIVVVGACSDSSGPPPVTRIPGLSRTSGHGQTGAPSQILPVAYGVRAVDSGGAPVVGVEVQWIARRGSVANASTTTGADGRSSNVATLSATAGEDTVLAISGSDTARFVALVVTSAGLVATVPVPANYGLHDTFVRDGLAFAFVWNTGIILYDVGSGLAGGGPAAPQPLDTIVTANNGVQGGAQVHNGWWFHNPVTNEKRYLFVGQEGPGAIGSTSSGDIHVVDVSDPLHLVEVAFYHLNGAGTHNFWMDEQAQVLYAAYYNGGVVALDVSGTLSGNLASRAIDTLQMGGPGNTYTWSVQKANGFVYASDMLSGVWQLTHSGSTLSVSSGGGNVPERYTSDFWVHGNHIYSGTWGFRSAAGNALKVWRLDAGGAPTLVDSVITTGIGTVSDVQVSSDGKLLVFSAEGGANAGLHVYGLTDPDHPNFLWKSPSVSLHTATIADINGRRYVFAAKNPANPAMAIYDITPLIP